MMPTPSGIGRHQTLHGLGIVLCGGLAQPVQCCFVRALHIAQCAHVSLCMCLARVGAQQHGQGADINAPLLALALSRCVA